MSVLNTPRNDTALKQPAGGRTDEYGLSPRAERQLRRDIAECRLIERSMAIELRTFGLLLQDAEDILNRKTAPAGNSEEAIGQRK